MSTAADRLAATRFLTRMPVPGRAIIETSDPLVVNSRFAEEFAPHQLEVMAGARSFRTVAYKAPMTHASVYYASSSADVRIVTRPVGDHFIFYLPLRGRVVITRRSGTVEVAAGQLGIVNPQDEYCLQKLDDCVQLTLKIRGADLERQARALNASFPESTLRFGTGRAADLEDHPLLFQVLETLYADLFTDQGVFLDPDYCAPMETLLARLLLREIDSNLRLHGGPAPYYVTRVERALTADPGRDWSIADMADVAGVSARTLFAGFRRYRGVSPLRHLKNTRLERVRRELRGEGDGRGRRSLTEIAHDLGFRHMSGFAGDYRRRFGERPSDTLRGTDA